MNERTATLPAPTLLTCGAAAGPVFVTVTGLQVLTRDGFDLARHPISLLALGDVGRVQTAAFVLAGLLALAGAAGMRRALHPGRAGTWGPWLVAAFGVGLVLGGVFPADPYLGFPAGFPTPATPSWHSVVHGLAPGLALDAVIVATAVLLHRFRRSGATRVIVESYPHRRGRSRTRRRCPRPRRSGPGSGRASRAPRPRW